MQLSAKAVAAFPRKMATPAVGADTHTHTGVRRHMGQGRSQGVGGQAISSVASARGRRGRAVGVQPRVVAEAVAGDDRVPQLRQLDHQPAGVWLGVEQARGRRRCASCGGGKGSARRSRCAGGRDAPGQDEEREAAGADVVHRGDRVQLHALGLEQLLHEDDAVALRRERREHEEHARENEVDLPCGAAGGGGGWASRAGVGFTWAEERAEA